MRIWSPCSPEYVGEKGSLIPLRRRRPHRGRARAVERRLEHALRPPRHGRRYYQRNNVTNDVLYKNGINCLVMPSAELSRGRGGLALGMSMPAWREAL